MLKGLSLFLCYLIYEQDATKGYLKLLLVTAASGDHVNGEAFHRFLVLTFLPAHLCSSL